MIADRLEDVAGDSWALALTRFLFGAVFGLFFQLPAAIYVDFAAGAYPWVFSVFLGALLTGFLCLSTPRRAWEPPLAYAVLAGIVLLLLYGRGKAGPRDLPMFGALFGGWTLLATAFAFHRKKNPPAA